MNQQDLINLKEALPFAAQSDAAKKFGITPSAVSQILSGKSKNDNVIEYLLQRAHAYQKVLDKIRKGFEELPQATGKEELI